MNQRIVLFTPGEQKIPLPTSGYSPPTTFVSYTISVKIEDQCVKFYYSDFPKAPTSLPLPGDGPLDIRIIDNYQVILNLEEGTHWEFRHDFASLPSSDPINYSNDAMTLGKDVPLSLYSNLQHLSPKQISFDVQHVPMTDPPPPNIHHPFNLYVYLDQSSGGNPTQIPIKIDPDILNPGDHH